jgi:acetylornithine deacetylase
MTAISAPVEFLRHLIALGREGEAAIQASVATRLEALGCTVDRIVYEPADVVLRQEFASDAALVRGERVAIVARFKGAGSGRSVILFAHPDSEPVVGTNPWRTDPFAGVIANGRLYGWGVADDLSGIAAMVSGLEGALADGWKPKGDIIIASTPSKRHARGVAAVLDCIEAPDAAIYLHPAESGAGMAEIKACTPGLLEFRVEITGMPPETAEPGQAAFAHRASSPATVVPAVLNALADLDQDRGSRIRHDRIESFVGRATNILISGITAGQPGARNRVPVASIIEGSVSFPPGEALEAVKTELEAAVRNAILPLDWPKSLSPRLSFPAGVTGAETPADHPLFLAVEAAVRAETGRSAMVNPIHTASDIRVPIIQKGIPTVGLGPLCGDLTQNGRQDEWVDAEDHLRCVRLVARALRNWCG